MVQREVADRFFAAPSTKAYGAVSVLVQLATERTGFHPVSRTVFRPQPNVDSALVAFSRTGLPEAYADVKRVVEAAFAHRRKTLPNSLELSGLASAAPRGGGARRDRPAAGRPRRGARAARVRRPGRGASVKRGAGARRRSTSRSSSARVAPTASTRLRPCSSASTSPTASRSRPARPSRSPASRRTRSFATRCSRSRLRRASSRAGRYAIDKRIPVAAGLGGGSSDAAAALRLANETLAEPLAADAAARDRGRARRRRSVLPHRTARSSAPETARASSRSSCRSDYWVAARAAHRRAEGLDGCGLRGVRRAPKDSTSGPRCSSRDALAAARPGRAAAERPRLVAPRGRAARPRCLPRRRHGRGPGRLRPLRRPRRAPRPPDRRARCPGAHLARPVLLGTVEPCSSAAPVIEHGSSRTGRWLRERTGADRALGRGHRGPFSIVLDEISLPIALVVAIAVVVLYFSAGNRLAIRRRRRDRLDRGRFPGVRHARAGPRDPRRDARVDHRRGPRRRRALILLSRR